MENQYNYYTPDEERKDEFEQAPKNPKKGRKTPKAVKVIALGLVFGLTAGVAFEGASAVTGKLLGTQTTANSNRSTKETVGSAKLTTGSGATTNSGVSEIAENAMPSVVSITNMSVKQVQNFFGGIQEQESESAGSGIIISQTDSELLVLTNNHVVEGSDTLTVSFIDEESVEANVKGTDSDRDLAVIAVQLSDIKDSTLKEIKVAQMGDSSSLKVGEQVIAIGNALGYGQSVTTGIVSATGRSLDGISSELIQTDAAINPGNSGGALLNTNGEVVGINTAKVATDAVEGMGYAIPISDAQDVITNLMNQKTKTKVEESKQGYLGIQGVNVSEDSAKMYGMPTGIYVSEAVNGGGAKEAGITKGMIITKIEGTAVSDMDALKEQLQYYAAGEKIKVTVEVPANNGNYKTKTVEVTLGSNNQN